MNIQVNKYQNYFFVGIGGIGMSALARYFINENKNIAGYDAVKSSLTEDLTNSGAYIFYKEKIDLIPKDFSKQDTLVIYTPAIDFENKILKYFQENDFTILKRSVALAKLSEQNKTIAIAGTHGKTTVTALVSHILNSAGLLKYAFVGGITLNYNSNFIDGKNKNGFIVLEADEYDKSFLHLKPYLSVITALEEDHLDIYKNTENLKSAFEQFAYNTVSEGIKLFNASVKINTEKFFTYSADNSADFYSKNTEIYKQKQYFDFVSYKGEIKELELNLPGKANIENAVASASVALLLGVKPQLIKDAIASFKGVRRRFERLWDTPVLTVISDYAHHPTELKALKNALEGFYPDKKHFIIFQPHLYSRTKDFAIDFANALDCFDSIIITDIYPAREKPLKNIGPHTILDKMKNKNKQYVPYSKILELVKPSKNTVLAFTGAGHIDILAEKFVKNLK